MITFRNIFESLGPSWLTSADGAKVFYSVGVLLDATIERMRQSLHARFPEYTETEDSLASIGRDRIIVRGRNESSDRYAKRLVEWRYPLGHRVRGNAWGLLRQIRGYFLDQITQFTVDRRGNWYELTADGDETYGLDTGLFAGGDDQPASPNWARFWLGLYGPVDWAYPALTIGDPDLWGGVIADDSEYVIGIDGATLSDIQAIRAMARDWKMAGSKAEYLLVYLGGGSVATDSYIQLVSTSWFELGGDVVAWGNAQTVVVPLT